MFIRVKFGSTDKINASTKIDGKKISVRGSRDYNVGTSTNADIIAEKLLNKSKEFGAPVDIEFARESLDDGYVYISLTQMTDKAVLSSNW